MKRNARLCAAIALCLLCGGTAADDLQQVVLVSGSPVEARLLSIVDQRATFLDAKNHEQPVAFAEFTRFGSMVDPVDVEQILMSDGSILVGRVTKFSRVQVVVETSLWGELTLPRSAVRGIVWMLPSDETEQWKLRDAISTEVAEDRLTLKNGDVLQGRLVSGDLTAVNEIRFASAAGELELKVDLIAAWQAGKVDATAEPQAIVGLSDGSRLSTSELRLDGNGLQAKLACGVHLGTVAGIRPADERLICFLQPFSDNTVYLSDIEPLGFRHIPYLQTAWGWRADRNVLGGPVSSAAGAYAKGIGMHSTSRLAFDLPEGFDEFRAELALDRTAGKRGSVTFRVFTTRDGKKWMEAFKSPIVRGGADAVRAQVDVRTARRIALVVDFADRADQLDRANWIDARLVRLK